MLSSERTPQATWVPQATDGMPIAVESAKQGDITHMGDALDSQLIAAMLVDVEESVLAAHGMAEAPSDANEYERQLMEMEDILVALYGGIPRFPVAAIDMAEESHAHMIAEAARRAFAPEDDGAPTAIEEDLQSIDDLFDTIADCQLMMAKTAHAVALRIQARQNRIQDIWEALLPDIPMDASVQEELGSGGVPAWEMPAETAFMPTSDGCPYYEVRQSLDGMRVAILYVTRAPLKNHVDVTAAYVPCRDNGLVEPHRRYVVAWCSTDVLAASPHDLDARIMRFAEGGTL